MKYMQRGILWVTLYAALTLAPLIIVLIGPIPPARSFWREFAVALGFIALAMIALQFLLTARFRRVAFPFGMDVILQFHKEMSILALVLTLGHVAILVAAYPAYVRLLNPLTAPVRAVAGQLGLLSLIFLVLPALLRERLRLDYEIWRFKHATLAVLLVFFAYWHVLGVGYYLSMPWKQALWAAMGASVVLVLFYLRIGRPLKLRKKPWRIVEIRPERGRSWTLALEPQGHAGMRFEAGQFAWLKIADTPFILEEHPYSFSSSADKTPKVEFTIKELGDHTSRMKTLSPGQTCYVEGPHGVFSFERYGSTEGFFFVAGGIGITPMMSMLRTLADRNDKRRHVLVYASRSWEDIVFREEIEELERKLDLRVVHVLDRAPEHWPGETGMVTRDLLKRYLPDERHNCQYFICGPGPMMDAVVGALRQLRVPLKQIHHEQFKIA